MLSFIGPGIAKYALRFGPPEYCGLIFFSLTAIVSLSGESVIKGVACGFVGLILASLGIDKSTGQSRLTFGSANLLMGFDIVAVVVGLFGIGEIFINAEQGIIKIYEGKIGKMMPRGKELMTGLLASCRGTLLGFALGLLPGMTPGSVAFIAYDFEKKISKHPEKFGTGVIEGVANVEAANNATAQANFIPLMTFGLPTGPSPAIILAALMLFGLQPGPSLFTQHKLFTWTIIGSMYIGNVILLILNLPLVGLWARLATIPYKYLGPTILAVCVIGAYSPRNAFFDVWVALGAGVVGYIMRRTRWPIVPLIMGFIFGPMLEHSLRQSIAMGGYTIFLSRPITMGFAILAVILVIVSFRYLKRVPRDDDTVVQT
jgi:putative tricarboxylic transport membrane protein